MDLDDDHFDRLLSGIEVSSPSGKTFIVKAAPRGMLLENDNAPSTNILVNLAWQVYLGVVLAFSHRWKVAVIHHPGRYLRRSVIHKEILPGGVLPDQRLQELVDRCCEGAFEDPGAMSEHGDELLAVFQFYGDSSDVDAYVSLQAAEGDNEGYDVRNGEGDFFAADGRVVEARIAGQWGQDVSLRVTDHHRSDELRTRLAAALPAAGIDASLANSPLAAAQVLLDAKWNARWPRWPGWLDRRLHGSKPRVVPPKEQS